MQYNLRYKIPNIHSNAFVSTVKFSPDGKIIATCSTDKTIKLWSTDSATLITTLRGHSAGISDIEFSPNGKYLASASDDLTIRLWDLSLNYKPIRLLNGHTYHVTCIRFDSRSRILVSASADENLRIWDIKRGRTMRTLSAHSDPVSSISLSFDDTIIVSGSHDGLIRLFDTSTGGCLKTLIYDKEGSSFPISNVLFSPNSKFVLASSLDGAIRLWDYMNNSVVKTFKSFNNEPVAQKLSLGTCFIFNNENNPYICSGNENGQILIWDIQSQDIELSLTASNQNSPIMNVASFDNGRILASVSLIGELYIWDRIDCINN
ncbi:hypothetical protein CANINC_003038 [Pichia inconspicua]|uniref:WDR5-like beta-propeller domain-containing protein n=1 Tax=Pichia inconspicua TaxID=52247 RepID=A0A4T0X171_9ASCO|nr:hypothetical protein CANINC_003038 [[Candida] inconspicua]